MKVLKKIVITLIVIIFLIVLGGFGYIYHKLNKMYVKDEPIKTEQGTTNKSNTVDGITNILLVGTDGKTFDKGNRSDSMMVLTIDSKNKAIKLSSIERDTYVDIPGHSTEKLTHAYAYGGINLLRQVFKINFDLDINKYVVVNFVSFMDIVDALGGVEVNIKEKDIKYLNETINSCYGYYNNKDEKEKKYINQAGVQRLNGYQALAFSRIRHNDDAFNRDNRQRQVLQSIYKEFLDGNLKEYNKCFNIILNNVKTNISPMEMIKLAYKVFKINNKNIQQMEFPLEEYRNGHIISKQKGWVLEWDKEPNLKAWHKFIFGDDSKK